MVLSSLGSFGIKIALPFVWKVSEPALANLSVSVDQRTPGPNSCSNLPPGLSKASDCEELA